MSKIWGHGGGVIFFDCERETQYFGTAGRILLESVPQRTKNDAYAHIRTLLQYPAQNKAIGVVIIIR